MANGTTLAPKKCLRSSLLKNKGCLYSLSLQKKNYSKRQPFRIRFEDDQGLYRLSRIYVNKNIYTYNGCNMLQDFERFARFGSWLF